MSWRGLYFSKPARLSLELSCLRMERREEPSLDFAIEDLHYVLLETPQVTCTSALLAACADQGCLVITCDAKHMPNGLLLPFQAYYQQLKTLNEQLALTEPRKKRLWQEIIKAKIRNQAACLKLMGRNAESVSRIFSLETKVKSGDRDNIEAVAARAYWPAYAQGFARDQDGGNRLNVMLNYAYALLRAAISRELALLGFMPALGLHHKNALNAFNLADDLMEPWRPLTDAFVLKYWLERPEAEGFHTSDRQALCMMLHSQALISGGVHNFLKALRIYVESIKKYYAGGKEQIVFPDFPLC